MATKSIVRYRNRPKAKHRRQAKARIPLAVLAGFVPTVAYCIEGARESSVPWSEVSHRLTKRMTGYDRTTGKWNFADLAQGWGPVVAGLVVHKLANRFGLNRMIARSGIPLVGF
jgi:hypothetical protein